MHACAQFLAMLALSSEFENIAVREEELPELDALSRSVCPHDIKGGTENKHGKVNILLQVRPRQQSFLSIGSGCHVCFLRQQKHVAGRCCSKRAPHYHPWEASHVHVDAFPSQHLPNFSNHSFLWHIHASFMLCMIGHCGGACAVSQAMLVC